MSGPIPVKGERGAHTPGPWSIDPSSGQDVIWGDFQIVAQALHKKNWPADAAHIVHCVNAHPHLVKALEGCQCPRPANNAPDDPNETTVAKCIARGECGCDCGAALNEARK